MTASPIQLGDRVRDTRHTRQDRIGRVVKEGPSLVVVEWPEIGGGTRREIEFRTDLVRVEVEVVE